MHKASARQTQSSFFTISPTNGIISINIRISSMEYILMTDSFNVIIVSSTLLIICVLLLFEQYVYILHPCIDRNPSGFTNEFQLFLCWIFRLLAVIHHGTFFRMVKWITQDPCSVIPFLELVLSWINVKNPDLSLLIVLKRSLLYSNDFCQLHTIWDVHRVGKILHEDLVPSILSLN